jgi:uncharacterized protein YbjQ (UPF0145 family)
MPGRVDSSMVTTALELPGHRIVRNFGVVRGIIVRSRSVIGNELLLMHAAQHGANAVVCFRYDATEVMQGVTEVLAYGTAVLVEPTS